MKRLLVLHSSLFILHFAALAANVTVSVDEDGVIQPQPAREAIGRAVSATVKVDLANAKAEILTNVAHIAIGTMKDANDLFTKFADFAIIDTFAVGLEDARGSTNTSSSATIAIVGNVIVDRTTDPLNDLVTLTWQYVDGDFEEPQMLASTTLATNAYETVWRGEPDPIEWGSTQAYRATAAIPKAKYGDTAFFKISGKVKGPIDDGQTFDTYSDGSDYWIELLPTNRYRMRIINSKITTIQLVQ